MTWMWPDADDQALAESYGLTCDVDVDAPDPWKYEDLNPEPPGDTR